MKKYIFCDDCCFPYGSFSKPLCWIYSLAFHRRLNNIANSVPHTYRIPCQKRQPFRQAYLLHTLKLVSSFISCLGTTMGNTVIHRVLSPLSIGRHGGGIRPNKSKTAPVVFDGHRIPSAYPNISNRCSWRPSVGSGPRNRHYRIPPGFRSWSLVLLLQVRNAGAFPIIFSTCFVHCVGL